MYNYSLRPCKGSMIDRMSKDSNVNSSLVTTSESSTKHRMIHDVHLCKNTIDTMFEEHNTYHSFDMNEYLERDIYTDTYHYVSSDSEYISYSESDSNTSDSVEYDDESD